MQLTCIGKVKRKGYGKREEESRKKGKGEERRGEEEPAKLKKTFFESLT
jgi:hypothetical protein